MKRGLKTASNSIVVFYFNSQDLQKIGTSTKKLLISQQCIRTQNGNLHFLCDPFASENKKNKKIKKLEPLAARALFVCLPLTILI
jgi:hypothetical protein